MTYSLNPFSRDPGVPYAAIGTAFSVTLGKMLDGGRSINPQSSPLPYIRAANVQESGLDLTDVNTMPFTATEAATLDLRRNDILVVEGGAVGTCLVLQNDMVGWSFQKTVNRLRPTSNWSSRYVAYVLRAYRDSGVIDIVCNRSTIPHLTAEKLRALRIPALEQGRQHAIADYLDQETAQIDALVAKQEEFTKLLKERRTRAREALAYRVTAGTRLRWMLREIDHRAGSRARDLPLFAVSIDWGVRRRDETTDRLSRAEDLSHYKVCLKGDIVVNRMRAFQGALGVAPANGVVSPDYAVLRATPEADPHWLAEVMRTRTFVGEIIVRLRGIGGTDSGNVRTPRINTADLLDIRVDVPEAPIQRTELSNLVNETSRIDALIGKAEEHIALAKERRSALITAAVTGQIDVRTARKAS